ncbi:MAG: hypothetical protein RL096_721, partial [Actinomycetota bacterium]
QQNLLAKRYWNGLLSVGRGILDFSHPSMINASFDGLW